MMTAKTSLRKFTPEFKTKAVLEVLKECQTLAELAKKHEIHPTQLTTWKKEFMKKSTTFFKKSGLFKKEPCREIEKLYAQIGQLQVENTFLKKKVVDKTSTQRNEMIKKSIVIEHRKEL